MTTENANGTTKTRSRFEVCLLKLEEVLMKFDALEKSEKAAREDLQVHLVQLLSEQRDELVRLKEEISTECRLENVRRARAKRRFFE